MSSVISIYKGSSSLSKLGFVADSTTFNSLCSCIDTLCNQVDNLSSLVTDIQDCNTNLNTCLVNLSTDYTTCTNCLQTQITNLKTCVETNTTDITNLKTCVNKNFSPAIDFTRVCNLCTMQVSTSHVIVAHLDPNCYYWMCVQLQAVWCSSGQTLVAGLDAFTTKNDIYIY